MFKNLFDIISKCHFFSFSLTWSALEFICQFSDKISEFFENLGMTETFFYHCDIFLKGMQVTRKNIYLSQSAKPKFNRYRIDNRIDKYLTCGPDGKSELLNLCW